MTFKRWMTTAAVLALISTSALADDHAGDPPPPRGTWGAIDDFMRRSGQSIEETQVLGMQLKLQISDHLAWTDNAFFQDDNENIVVNRNVVIPGTNPDADSNGNVRAFPGFPKQRGEVSEFVNTARIEAGLAQKLNTSLAPLLFEGDQELQVFSLWVESKEYWRHGDSPDALNYGGRIDFPVLLNNILRRYTRVNASNNRFYFRLEGDYERVTEPLDVAELEALQVLNSRRILYAASDRHDFDRENWYFQPTLGWKGGRLDAMLRYRYDSFTVKNDESLQPADHAKQTYYGEVGWSMRRAPHRFYGFYEYSEWNYDYRYGDGSAARSLRDFGVTRTGLGWEGPLLSKKVQAQAELYYLTQRTINGGSVVGYIPRTALNPNTGRVVLNSNGKPVYRDWDEHTGLGGSARVVYRPWLEKSTVFQGEYRRYVEGSVVSDNRVIDEGVLSMKHAINERLTMSLSYGVTFENVAYQEKRLFQEWQLGLQYQLMSHTTADLNVAHRRMISRNEPVRIHPDASNELFAVQADGDFVANVVSVGVTVRF